MFTIEGQSLHKWSTFQVSCSWAGSYPNPQALELGWKGLQGTTNLAYYGNL
jgi:hypothetical protein